MTTLSRKWHGSATINRDSNLWPASWDGFEATRDSLQWRIDGQTQYRRVYLVSDETASWDLGSDYRPEDGSRLMALGSRYGVFSYLEVRTVGRKETLSPSGKLGTRVRIRFVNQTSSGTIWRNDEVVAWMVPNYWAN